MDKLNIDDEDKIRFARYIVSDNNKNILLMQQNNSNISVPQINVNEKTIKSVKNIKNMKDEKEMEEKCNNIIKNTPQQIQTDKDKEKLNLQLLEKCKKDILKYKKI